MPATVPLNETTAAALDVNGAVTLKLGPQSAREKWHPANVHVGVATNVNEATCTVYIGDSARAATFRDATYSGSSGDMLDGLIDVVTVGQYIIAQWTGGDPTATATLNVTGTKEI